MTGAMNMVLRWESTAVCNGSKAVIAAVSRLCVDKTLPAPGANIERGNAVVSWVPRFLVIDARRFEVHICFD